MAQEAPRLELVRTESVHLNGTALLMKEEVWLTFGAHWWNFRAWLWWWFCTGPKAWVLVNSKGQGQRVRVRAVRIARTYVRSGDTLP